MPVRADNRITDLVIHCAATPNGRPYSIQQIDSDHRARGFRRDAQAIKDDARGLTSIGYHRVIQPDGTVEQGREFREWGAHAPRPSAAEEKALKAWGLRPDLYLGNPRSIGVCLIGTDKFTLAQWSALADEVTRLRARFPMIGRLWSHNHLTTAKRCPCFDVRDWEQGGMRPIAGMVL